MSAHFMPRASAREEVANEALAPWLFGCNRVNGGQYNFYSLLGTSAKFSPHCGVVDSALVLRYHGCGFESQLAGH